MSMFTISSKSNSKWQKIVTQFSLISFLMVAFLVLTACIGRSISTTWSYDRFIQAVEQGQIEAVTISSDRSEAIAQTQQGENISVELPVNDPDLVDRLNRNDVAITVKPQVDQTYPLDLAFGLIPGIIFLVGFFFWLWVLIDCAMQESSQGNTKVIWVLIILFANGIGALIYFFVRRPQRRRELGH